MQLFDDFERTRMTYAGHAEPEYKFLNTSAFRFVDRVRQYSQQWFDRYAEDGKADLYSRFVSKNDVQHASASFELLLHELLLRLGFDVTVHPDVPSTSRRPDFFAANATSSFYLETHVIYRNLTERLVTKHEKRIYDWINEWDSSDFMLTLDAYGVLDEQPSKAQIRPLRLLMESHDPDRVCAMVQHGDYYAAPSETVVIGNWRLTAHLFPIPKPHRGRPDMPTIASTPSGFTYANCDSLISHKLRNKAAEKQVARLDAPLVLAVKVASSLFSLERDVMRTVIGRVGLELGVDETNPAAGMRRSTDGVWFTLDGKPKFNNLQAIWFFCHQPTAAPTPVGPRSLLVFNPNVTFRGFESLSHVPHLRLQEDLMRTVNGQDLNDVLGAPLLPESEWE